MLFISTFKIYDKIIITTSKNYNKLHLHINTEKHKGMHIHSLSIGMNSLKKIGPFQPLLNIQHFKFSYMCFLHRMKIELLFSSTKQYLIQIELH